MIGEILKDNLARSLTAAFVSEEQIEALIRPVLERYGLKPREVDELVEEARANVRTWKASTSLDVPGLMSSGTRGFMHALGVPTRDEIDELMKRVDDLTERLPPADSGAGTASSSKSKRGASSRGRSTRS